MIKKITIKPPNYRDSECCLWCKHAKCVHSCGCCPPEYVCELHGDYPVGSGEVQVCDSFEEDVMYRCLDCLEECCTPKINEDAHLTGEEYFICPFCGSDAILELER